MNDGVEDGFQVERVDAPVAIKFIVDITTDINNSSRSHIGKILTLFNTHKVRTDKIRWGVERRNLNEQY